MLWPQIIWLTIVADDDDDDEVNVATHNVNKNQKNKIKTNFDSQSKSASSNQMIKKRKKIEFTTFGYILSVIICKNPTNI